MTTSVETRPGSLAELTGQPGVVVLSGRQRLGLGQLPRSAKAHARRAEAVGWRWSATYTRVREPGGRVVASLVLRCVRDGRHVVAYWRTKADGAYALVCAYRWRTERGRVLERPEAVDAKTLTAELGA